MRRLWLTLPCALTVQLIAAAPAHAWWEFLEALRGPKLHGPFVDLPLVCFMEPRNEEDAIDVSIAGAKLPCVTKIHDPTKKVLRRRFSIDLSVRYHWDEKFGPANGQTVHFVSTGFLFTWHPALSRDWDMFAISAGNGLSWFVSDAFPDFKADFWDLRADVHLPSSWRYRGGWRKLIPAGRVGVLVFPSGFEENVFADVENGFTSKSIAAPEGAKYVGLFWDLDALVN